MNKEILNILKSWNFTIVWTDNWAMSLYKGKVNINKLDGIDPIYEFDRYWCDSYIPEAVALLAKCLWWKTDSY